MRILGSTQILVMLDVSLESISQQKKNSLIPDWNWGSCYQDGQKNCARISRIINPSFNNPSLGQSLCLLLVNLDKLELRVSRIEFDYA